MLGLPASKHLENMRNYGNWNGVLQLRPLKKQ